MSSSPLYRSFLRVLEKWPLDPTKKGRDLGEYIRLCVAEAFHGSLEPRDANKCQEVQESLSRLSHNTYKNAFFVARVSSSTGLAESECQQIVSNEFLKLLEEEEKGRVKTWKEKLFNKKDKEDK